MATLICELNNTLLHTDTQSESLIQKLAKGMPHVLEYNNTSTAEDYLPPINESILDLLEQRKSLGDKLILISPLAPQELSTFLKNTHLFDEITTPTSAEQLTLKYGHFDYAGTPNTTRDIWQAAQRRYVVNASEQFIKDFTHSGLDIEQHFQAQATFFQSLIESLRPYQWLKNLLVFVPIVTSQQLTDSRAIINSLILFICFSLVASFGYIVNDLLDVQSDRAHPIKKKRPFAQGALTLQHGVITGVLLLIAAAIGCAFLPFGATLALGCYLLLSVFYSIYLKTKIMIDVVILGALFTIRVIGGAEAIETELSFYLLSFSIFLFASLGMVKRYTELLNLQKRNKLSAKGRGYQVEDMAPVRIIGISMGYMSVFILGQYMNSPVVKQYYDNPTMLWLLFPLLMFWLGRLWIRANRGEVNEDPLLFTVKDTTSQLVILAGTAILILAD